MKGLILSGGYGTRLRPLTYSQQKQLIPVGNKPILFYAIEDVIEAGVKDIGIIVGPNKEQVIEMVRSKKWGANIEFIYQPEPKGLAHAIIVAEEYLNNEAFVMYLGDNILKEGIAEHVNDFIKSKAEASILLTEVPNPEEFGIAQLNEKNEIVKLIEKPKKPPSNFAVIGIYMFRPAIFKAVKEIKPSWRNQLEIVDAIQWLIDNGYKVKSSFVKGWWKDTGKPEDIIHANRLVLDEIEETKNFGVLKNSKINGRVIIEKNAIIENSLVKGPAIIGENSKIVKSYIGPYMSIGNNCEILDTEIEDSVIMEGTKIKGVGRITESLIGKNVKIVKNNDLPRGHKLIVGDNSEVKVMVK
ncbi:glucose-1-phosphate thymidylyltransferase [Thermoplasmatales archaeon ex4484_30]|nr:MAG: glucose-1-phosphate thymidylyltransferase [Thermoplasmatales archaeon ex4484_30]